jgi:hypothetical protein
MANKPWARVGTLKKSKAGNLYITVEDDITLKKGATIMLKDPRKELAESKAAGRLDADKADAMIAKIPEFVRYNLSLAPDKE